MALDKRRIAQLYRTRARHYDVSANLYYLLGLREFAYWRMAVDALRVNGGDTVVEIGCGTGLNFRLLQARVGAKGRIIGVDLTPEMLARAEERVQRRGWSNVELVQSDAAEYRFSERVDGILSTFAITLIPEYDRVIRNGAAALSVGKRFVILDFREPQNWPRWLIRFFVFITHPFGVSLDLAHRHPWESIDRYLAVLQLRTLYWGAVYLCVGEKRATPSQDNPAEK